MSELNFTAIGYRDAWFVIRGFVYQVDLTIMHWLMLKDNQILELESGEDIDIITLNHENKEQLRELLQTKHRQDKITLNDDGVFEILFNYFTHIRANKNHELIFKYITNTDCGQERPSLFPTGLKAIEVWNDLSAKLELKPENDELKSIQDFIIRKIEKEITKTSQSTESKEIQYHQDLLDFKNFIGDNNQFKSYVVNFKWSLKNNSSDQLSETIKNKLIELGCVSDLEQAYKVYPG